MIKGLDLRVDGLKIAGQLHLPDKSGGPWPGVILCHGVPSGQVDPADGGYPLLAATIAEQGFGVYTFRFRGCGESEGNFDIAGWLRDAAAAVNLMSACREINAGRIALVGFSAGAAVSICTAAVDKRVAAVAACASPADFSAISNAEKPQYTVSYFRKIGIIRDENYPASTEQWLNGFRRVSALECVGQIAPRQLLLLHSENDPVVPVNDSRRLFERAGDPKQIKVFPGAEHRLRLHPEAVALLIDWLRTGDCEDCAE
jgi:fermentation-respiration switch protein FrsA (DUF1100 family)